MDKNVGFVKHVTSLHQQISGKIKRVNIIHTSTLTTILSFSGLSLSPAPYSFLSSCGPFIPTIVWQESISNFSIRLGSSSQFLSASLPVFTNFLRKLHCISINRGLWPLEEAVMILHYSIRLPSNTLQKKENASLSLSVVAHWGGVPCSSLLLLLRGFAAPSWALRLNSLAALRAPRLPSSINAKRLLSISES